MPSIGVVVSCYKPHLDKLRRLLDSIAAQTRLPDEVIVSNSSTADEDVPVFPQYTFPFRFINFEVRKNAAMNRNTAARFIRSDILCFIDADDIMHPQRLEAVEAAFHGGAEFVMHDYLPKSALNTEFPFYNSFDIEYNCLRPAPSGCVIHVANKPIHHSLSSVLRRHFEKVQFQEGPDYERREDAVFCNGIVRLGVPTACIHNKLAKYDEAGSWENVTISKEVENE